MPLIRRCARQVAQRFQAEKIILFGSYACGIPHGRAANSQWQRKVSGPARTLFY